MSEGKSQAPPPLELTHSTLPVVGGPPRLSRSGPPPLPLWAKWVLSVLVAVCLVGALIVYVDHHNTDYTPGYPITKKAAVEADREATVLVEEDQAPRVFTRAAGAPGAHLMARAVRAVMQERIDTNQAGPPLKPARCQATATAGGRDGYACTVLAGGILYDFQGVFIPSTHMVTVCKRDPPPVPSEVVPVNRRCLA